MQQESSDALDWLESAKKDERIADVVGQLDPSTQAFVRRHEPGPAKFSLLKVHKYQHGKDDLNSYTRKVFEQNGVKKRRVCEVNSSEQHLEWLHQSASDNGGSIERPVLNTAPTLPSSSAEKSAQQAEIQHQSFSGTGSCSPRLHLSMAQPHSSFSAWPADAKQPTFTWPADPPPHPLATAVRPATMTSSSSPWQPQLPDHPSSDEAKRIYYRSCMQELQRHHGPQQHLPNESSEPDAQELERVVYYADLCLNPKARLGRRIMLKKPCVNAHMKRCFYRFGSDRFLFVNVPNKGLELQHLEPVDLCNRHFVFLFPKRTMASSKQLKAESSAQVVPGGYGYVVAVFFAEKGPNLAHCTADQVRSWHLPIDLACASAMTVSKYAERFKLAFSDIERTVEVEAANIEVWPDLMGRKGMPNTDGNGLCSADLFEKIAETLGYPGRRISAIQMRLGPAKGMLVRSDSLHCSKVILFSSQVKYGDQAYYCSCDPGQRTIEVCANGVVWGDEEPRQSSRLNSQLILVLQSIGCPANILMGLDERLRQYIESIMTSTTAFVQSDFLPNADVADGHASDLCFEIHAMHAAGMDHRTDNYLFMCIRNYIISQLRKAREGGHVPCPDTYSLIMVSDFSQTLRPGTYSAHRSGHGFDVGRRLVTRIPCSHPSDIVLLDAVDDFSRRKPNFAYENLAVMSAHAELDCSPASQMSGGDYDGDRMIAISFPPIVDNVQTQKRELTTREPDPLKGEYCVTHLQAVIKENEQKQRPLSTVIESRLKSLCLRMVGDADMVAKFNVMWTHRADRDISSDGKFSNMTLMLVQYQELALDAAKTGWRIKPDIFQLYRNEVACRRPHWCPPLGPSDKALASKSALGQLHDLEDPAVWTETALEKFGPENLAAGNSLINIADSLAAKLRQDDINFYCRIWESTYQRYRNDTKTIRQASPGVTTYQQAKEIARTDWHRQVDEAGCSREAFALTAYKADRGEEECWKLCFPELCHVFTTKVAGKEPVTVARGGCVRLRPTANLQSKQASGIGSLPIAAEQTLQAVFCKNLKNMAKLRGPSDGGDLAHVPRDDPFLCPVDDIRFTHKDPSDHFSDGTPISSLVAELADGLVSRHADFLILDVVLYDGAYWTLRNRRLVALRTYQERLREGGSDDVVEARVCLLPLTHPSVHAKFVEGFSTETFGETVELRVSSKSRLQSRRDAP